MGTFLSVFTSRKGDLKVGSEGKQVEFWGTLLLPPSRSMYQVKFPKYYNKYTCLTLTRRFSNTLIRKPFLLWYLFGKWWPGHSEFPKSLAFPPRFIHGSFGMARHGFFVVHCFLNRILLHTHFNSYFGNLACTELKK